MVDVKITYSEQAELLIARIKDFSKEEFERDYLSNITIGDQTIWQYIVEKEVEKNKEVKPNA